MNAIEVNHLWKQFRLNRTHPRGGSLRDAIPRTIGQLLGRNGQPEDTFWALKDISFAVAPGEALGIIGPNGAGKSTILKLLSGILRPDRGTVRVAGRIAALIELGAGFHLDLSGRENVYLNGTILGLKKREIDRRFDEIVDFAGIEEFIDTPVKHYSSGMYLRLGFAVAVHTHPDLLLVDEVLAVGDLAFQRKCLEKIEQLKNKGVAIILVSHNLEMVARLCPRAVFLRMGEIRSQGDAASVAEQCRQETLEHNKVEKGERVVSPLEPPRKVEIAEVYTMDKERRRRQRFETGEQMVVRIEYRAKEVVEEPVFGVAIHSSKGLYCYGTNSRNDDIRVDLIDGEGAIELEYSSLNLLSGSYAISVGVFDENAIIPYDFQEKICLFTVVGNRLDHGLIYLDHRWTQKKVFP